MPLYITNTEPSLHSQRNRPRIEVVDEAKEDTGRRGSRDPIDQAVAHKLSLSKRNTLLNKQRQLILQLPVQRLQGSVDALPYVDVA